MHRAALVNWQSGMTLGTAGGGPNLNLDIAAAGNTDVVRAKLKVMQNLGLNDKIEDILITLSPQYHLIRLLERDPSLFLHVALMKEQANPAMARYKITQIERQLTVQETFATNRGGTGSHRTGPPSIRAYVLSDGVRMLWCLP